MKVRSRTQDKTITVPIIAITCKLGTLPQKDRKGNAENYTYWEEKRKVDGV